MKSSSKSMVLIILSLSSFVLARAQTVINVKTPEQFQYYYNNFVSKEIRGYFTYSTFIRTEEVVKSDMNYSMKLRIKEGLFTPKRYFNYLYEDARMKFLNDFIYSNIKTNNYIISVKHIDSTILLIKDYVLLQLQPDSALISFRIPNEYSNSQEISISITRQKQNSPFDILQGDGLFKENFRFNSAIKSMHQLGKTMFNLRGFFKTLPNNSIHTDNEVLSLSRVLNFNFNSNPAPAKMYFMLSTTYQEISKLISLDNEENIKKYSCLSLSGKTTNTTLTLPEKNFVVFFVHNGKILVEHCIPKASVPLNNNISVSFQ